jgi:hypothetical protein
MSAAAAAIPAASAVVESDAVAVMPIDDLIAQFKLLSQPDLFKAMKQLTNVLEKASKDAAKPTKAKKASKKAANPNKSYDQLKKPRAWVNFVLQDALQNGWPAFSITQSKKDKDSGDKIEEITDMPESECVDGVYCYKGSVDPATGKGKPMITKHAMSLSKIYWSNKDKTGTRKDLYDAFEEQYVNDSGNESAAASESESQDEKKVVVVRKTASQKTREAEEKKAAKLAEKEAAKLAKEAEKAAAKAAKEAEKAAKPASKAKAAAAPASPAAPVAPVAPAAPVAPVAAAPAPATATAAPKAKKPVAPKAKKVVDNWVAPDEDGFHDWTWDNKLYFRNFKNHIFTQTADGQVGEWVGLWIPAELRFDPIETPAEYLESQENYVPHMP